MYRHFKNDVLLNYCDDISTLGEFLIKNKRVNYGESSDKEKGSSWCDTDSLNEAMTKFIYGDDDFYKKINTEMQKLDVTKIIGNERNKRKMFDDVVGFQPNIPNYLKGIPKSMINDHKEVINNRVLNIVLNIAVNCTIDQEDMLKQAVVCLKTIEALEKAGYRCNLYVADITRNSSCHCMAFKVKTDKEPFNLKKVAFPVCSPSVHRRVFFKYLETIKLPDGWCDVTRSGYGSPGNNERAQTLLEEVINKEVIMWSYQDESFNVTEEEIIRKIEQSGINIKGEEK